MNLRWISVLKWRISLIRVKFVDTKLRADISEWSEGCSAILLCEVESGILQEKRGFFFCLEDRALLCRDCDVSIHTANTLSCNHRRYLVPGTRVHLEDVKGVPVKPIAPEVYLPVASPAASSMSQSSHSSRSSNLSSSTSTLPGPRILSKQTSNAKPSGSVCSPSPVQTFTLEMVQAAYSGKVNAQAVAEATKPTQQFSASQTPPLVSLPSMGVSSSGSMRKSSISEFLTDAVPGWRVDELLNFADCNEQFNPTDFSTSKMMEGETAVEGDYDWTADLSLFEAQMFSMHEVPQFPPPPPTLSASPKSNRVARQLQRISHIKQGSYLQDAFLVPDVRIASAPTSQSVPKRFKRDLYHMLNWSFLEFVEDSCNEQRRFDLSETVHTSIQRHFLVPDI